MKESALPRMNNDNPKKVVLDEAGKKRFLKCFQDTIEPIRFLREQLDNGNLTEGMKVTLLGCAEHSMSDMQEELKYDGDLQKDMKERYKALREANQTITELRKRLGDKFTTDDIREKLKNLGNLIEKWWRYEGFGHISEIKFTSYGYTQVKLSGMVCYPNHFSEDKKMTDEIWLNKLKEKGFEFLKEGVTVERIVQNDNSIEALKKMILDRFPSAKITKLGSMFEDKQKVLTFWDIEFYIYDLDDIERGNKK